MNPGTPTEELLYCVKRVEANTSSGQVSVGTGYLCRMLFGVDRAIDFCITNKHVIEGAASIRILMHTATIGVLGPDGGHTFLSLTGQINVPHNDASVDLCALMIGPSVNEWNTKNPGKSLFYRTLQEELIFDQQKLSQLDALEPILMIGCPNGLWDELNGFPLLRRGVTASHPAIDFGGKGEFAVDVGVYSGSSGSPIFLFDSGLIRQDKKVNTFSPGVRFGLIGTLWGGPRINEQGQVKVEAVPTSNKITAEIGVRMHIGYAIKSTQVLTLIQQIKIQAGIA